MQQLRLNGPGAGSDKYDLLTALSVAALAQGGQMQISLLRLMAVVTARYNWAQDELSLGQREMAQMWSVEERTAKREVRRLLDLGLLVLLRRGVKGRVACYRLDLAKICALTESHWGQIGRDYEARMAERHQSKAAPPEEAPKVVRVDFGTRTKQPAEIDAADPWGRVLQRLERADPARHAAWFANLRPTAISAGQIELLAPSGFVAQYVATHFLGVLETALQTEFGAEIRCTLRG